MADNFLISVDVDNVDATKAQGLGIETLSYTKRVLISASGNGAQSALDFISRFRHRLTIFCDCSELSKLEDVVTLLNQGCSKILLKNSQSLSLIQEGFLSGDSEDRLIVTDSSEAKAPRYLHIDDNIADNYAQAVKNGNVAIVPATKLTAAPSRFPNLYPLHRLITSAIHSDRPDGLYPTVVSDRRGVCLGLVYSNDLSIQSALETGRGVYHSRSRNKLWIKGEESGDIQELIDISWDCDTDTLQFRVNQKGAGFCHLKRATCFGPYEGLSRLEATLEDRKRSAPAGSYTSRLFNEPKLLNAKILEEAEELCEAKTKDEIAAEAADLFYFAMARCIAADVSLGDVEANLDLKSLKVQRRKGDAKPKFAEKVGLSNGTSGTNGSVTMAEKTPGHETLKEAASVPKAPQDPAGLLNGRIRMRRFDTATTDRKTTLDVLQRPSQRSTDEIMKIVKPIVKEVQTRGDKAVLEYTHKFEKATSLTSPVLKAPFAPTLMQMEPKVKKAIDISFDNIRKFHTAQSETKPLKVETMPGVVCSRFQRPIEKVGLYVPGGTAVLPSTALMLGVPAMVAGCKTIVIASPPRSDGTITPEIVYIADKIGAESILMAGGAQAVAALAYGTESVSKVDKILGPGNQFVTAGKMLVSNDTTASVSIDMPAGPSEVLVIADKTSNPAFVASDLLSQAEHGTDSQVVLLAIDLDDTQLLAIEDELHRQAYELPRVDIVRGAIEHSITLVVRTVGEAMEISNEYAPEHLIIQTEHAADLVSLVTNAGSVFIGPWTPESVGDYSAGVNHSLPTYGYARQYSGVNLSSFTKHITSSQLSADGLVGISDAVMDLAEVEKLQAHRRAVSIRLEYMKKGKAGREETVG